MYGKYLQILHTALPLLHAHCIPAYSFTEGVKKHKPKKVELMTKQAILDGNIMKESAEAHGTVQ